MQLADFHDVRFKYNALLSRTLFHEAVSLFRGDSAISRKSNSVKDSEKKRSRTIVNIEASTDLI